MSEQVTDWAAIGQLIEDMEGAGVRFEVKRTQAADPRLGWCFMLRCGNGKEERRYYQYGASLAEAVARGHEFWMQLMETKAE